MFAPSALISALSISAAALHHVSSAPAVTGADNTQLKFLSWEQAHEKASATIATLNTQEKTALVSGVGFGVGNCVGNIDEIPSIPNFHGLCMQDGPAGMRYQWFNSASAFTSSLNLAATWDKELVKEAAQAMGEEFKAKGVNVALTPMVNMVRAPQGGRNWESFGEDPFLQSSIASAYVESMEGIGLMTTLKHFIGNEQEHFREAAGGATVMDYRALNEIYLPPFKAGIEAGASSVMCAYNRLRLTSKKSKAALEAANCTAELEAELLEEEDWSCAHNTAMNGILKGQLGFKGFVMSDWWATHDTTTSAMNGLDMMMPNGADAKPLPEPQLTEMSTRILAAWYRRNQDSPAYPPVRFSSFNPDEATNIDVRGDHDQVIRKVGAASIVLLKNKDNVLPLRSEIGNTLAVIGTNAKTATDPNVFPDRAGVDGHVAIGWGSGTANFPYLSSPLDAIRQKCSARGGKKPFRVGSYVENNTNYTSIQNLAQRASVALVFVYSDSGEAFLTVEGNSGDRNNLNLWDCGDDLINSVAAVNSRTVVVITGPGAVNMDTWINHPNVTSVVMATFPGQESGNAIADVLFGDVNPSAKLPFTVAKKEEDYCCKLVTAEPGLIEYAEGINIGYRWFDSKDIPPLFEFGFGLSYTTFEYSDLKIAESSRSSSSNNNGDDDDKSAVITVSLNVKNTGALDGAEVVQLYLGLPQHTHSAPKNLKGFEKVQLPAGGESVRVEFKLTAHDMSFWDVEKCEEKSIGGGWNLPSGDFKVMVGASSRDIRLTGGFRL